MRIADPHSTRTDHLPLSVLQTHTTSKISLPIQLTIGDLTDKMPLGMQADSVSVLDQSLSKCLPGTADTVSADGECAARLPWVARLGQAGPAHHLGLISAPWQQPMCRERRISVKHDVIDVLVIEVALSHSFAGILVPSLSFPVSLSFFGPSLCASARGQSAIFHLICKLRHI